MIVTSQYFLNIFAICSFEIFVLYLLFFLSCHQETPLHNAAKQGYVDIVKFLVSKNADIKVQNEYLVSVVILPGIVFSMGLIPSHLRESPILTAYTCLIFPRVLRISPYHTN